MHKPSKHSTILFSEPQRIELPDGFPFIAYISAVELPEGCMPPSNSLQRRIAIGRGASAEEASYITYMEAIERYCLQYTTNLPSVALATQTFGASSGTCSTQRMYLGHPRTSEVVRSTGSASGKTFQDAGTRAVLELLERRVVEAPKEQWKVLRPAEIEAIQIHVDWLEKVGRKVVIRVLSVQKGVYVALVGCTDFDGGRPTEGSAAGLNLASTVKRACEEAMLSWRNMVQIEMNALGAQDFPPDERQNILLYRGSIPNPYRSLPEMERFEVSSAKDGSHLSLSQVAEVSFPILGTGLSLYDISHHSFDITVVRAIVEEGR